MIKLILTANSSLVWMQKPRRALFQNSLSELWKNLIYRFNIHMSCECEQNKKHAEWENNI